MPLDLDAIAIDCKPIAVIDGSCIRFPGGAEICFNFGRIPSDEGEAIRGLLAQANTALAPLAPIFNIIDAIVAIFDCVSAVPDAIVELDPVGLFECAPNMAEKVGKLAGLIPQLSLPALLVDLLELLIKQLQDLRAGLRRVALYQAEVIAAGLAAAEPGAVGLRLAVDCAQSDIDAELIYFNEMNGGLNRLIGVIGVLLKPFGIDLSEALGEITDIENIETTLAPIDALIDVLTVTRSVIPIP
jgi:hypothetical protein